ncbi:MAG: DegV family protein [Oscillospiraceae bacterium]|nr:DegV family protein [Oscillospiraceae bacterium]
MSYCIFTDTSANLPTELTEEKGITVVPFSYRVNNEEFMCTDTRSFDGADFYGAIRKHAKVNTSQINPFRYEEYMEPVLQAGSDILYIGMSSGISGSYASACTAIEQLHEKFPEREIRAIDTLSASLGEGVVVLKAVEYRDAGMPLDEAEKLLREMSYKICQIFMVDDLMHLRRTGRLSNAVALAGSVLQIKPLLKGDQKGQIVCIKKERGRRRAIEALVKVYAEYVENAGEQIVGIAHADCAEDAQKLADRLREVAAPAEILTVCYEPVTGSHVGPDTLALFFVGRDGFRTD